MNEYISQLSIFLATAFIFLVATVAAAFFFKKISVKEYLYGEEGQGALKSAGLAFGVIIVVSLMIYLLPNNANAGTWFNDASVYMGMDYVNDVSPQCEEYSSENRITSNLGIRGNFWQNADKNIRINGKTTHHSCTIGVDKNTYDAFSGVELEWILFKRQR